MATYLTDYNTAMAAIRTHLGVAADLPALWLTDHLHSAATTATDPAAREVYIAARDLYTNGEHTRAAALLGILPAR
jgi:hypothetical protein